AGAPPGDRDATTTALALVDARLRALVPFAVMTKFVPEALLQCLGREGDHSPPPFPDPTPGRRLAAAVVRLAQRCDRLGYGPDRLATEWPDVAPEVSGAVRVFCQQQTGFGPVAWESPGYETPGRVFDAMAATLGGGGDATSLALAVPDDLDPGPRRLSMGTTTPSAAGSLATALRTALGTWLEFLDLEIWHLRRAFYLAVIPAIRVLASSLGVDAEELLFAPMEELGGGEFDPGTARERRREYEADAEYLDGHGVRPERLAAIV